MRFLYRVLAVAFLPGVVGAQGNPAQLDTIRVQVVSRVTSAFATVARSVEVLDRAALERLPARTLGEALARTVGVDVPTRSAASADLSIRGSSFEQVLVLVDGIRVSDDQTGHFDLDLAVPLETVERVEVLRGPASSLYGADAIGGVINVVTRAAATRTSSLTVEGGSFGSAAMAIAGTLPGRVALRGGADLQRADGHRPGTDYDVAQVRVGAAGRTAVGRLDADIGAAIRDFGAADFYGAYPSHERTGAGSASLRLESDPSERVTTTVRVGARQHTDRFTLWRDEPARYQNRHETWQLSSEGVARVSLERVAFAAGLSGERSQLRSARLGNHLEHRVGVFGEASVGGVSARRLEAGLRTDWSSINGSYLSPSLAGSLPINGQIRLRANVARGFRAPTWTERYYRDPANQGDPSLLPETFWLGEAGVVTTHAHARGEITGFMRRASGLIDWARPRGSAATTPWRTMNVESATFRGIEALLRLDGAGPAAVTLRAMGLHLRADDAAAYQGKYALRPLTRSAGVTVDIPIGRGIGAAIDASHRRRALEPGHERLDARLSYRLRALHAYVDLVNLGGADYLDAAGKPVAGRSLHVGAALRRTAP